MRTVVWSDDALDDVDALILHVAKNSPKGALTLVERIDQAASGLSGFASGRPGRVKGSYEKVVGRTPYILAYAVTDNRVTILRVIHGSRDWPEGEWPAE